MRFHEFISEEKLNGITIIPLDKFVKYGYPEHNDMSDIDMDDEDSFDEEEYVHDIIGEADFGLGARYRKAGDEEMQDYLRRVKNKETNKLDPYKMPYVHGSNIKIKDEDGDNYDLDALRDLITTRPTSLLKQNEKMKHSDGSAEVFYNTSLPALKGLAVNEETGEFVIVDTCPGAGSCKIYCYAKRGSYVMFKAVSMKQTQTLNFLLNDPDGFTAQLSKELEQLQEKWKDQDVQIIIRFHDAGDWFSDQYVQMAYTIARAFPQIKFYAYTKLSKVAMEEKPENFEINFSGGALSSEEKKINFVQIKHSYVVPKELFRDLVLKKDGKLVKDEKGRMQFKDEDAWEEFKDRLVEKYNIKRDSILSYDEMMEIPEGDEMKWNTVVVPGDGDNAAARRDILGVLLLFH